MLVGVAIWLPWSPVFLFQALHTGTPWTTPPGRRTCCRCSASSLVLARRRVLRSCSSAWSRWAYWPGQGQMRPAWLWKCSAQPRARFVAYWSSAPGRGGGGGHADRRRLRQPLRSRGLPFVHRVLRAGRDHFQLSQCHCGDAGGGLCRRPLHGPGQNSQPRTQAVQVAADLNAQAQPGDVVVYCPDQLGPAVNRLLDGPGRNAADFSSSDRAGPGGLGRLCLGDPAHPGRDVRPGGLGPGQPRGTLWLVWRNGYQGFGSSCGNLASWLQMLSPGGQTLITQDNYLLRVREPHEVPELRLASRHVPERPRPESLQPEGSPNLRAS